jgi:hypothetical protein
MALSPYRLIDTSGSEIGIVKDERSEIAEGDTVELPDGTSTKVVEIYDDEFGQEGDVQATLVVEEDRPIADLQSRPATPDERLRPCGVLSERPLTASRAALS